MTGSFDLVEQWESGIVSDCEQQSPYRCYLPFGLDIAEYASMVDFRCRRNSTGTDIKSVKDMHV